MLAVLVLACPSATSVLAQETGISAAQVSAPAPAEQAATLVYANRPIVELRANVLSRTPVQRAEAAVRALDGLVARDVTSPVSTRAIGGAVQVVVGGEGVFAIVPADVDALTGETPQQIAGTAVSRLQVALAEAGELRTPGRVARAALQVVGITVVLAAALWALRQLQLASTRRIARLARPTTGPAWSREAMRVTHVPHLLNHGVAFVFGSVAIVLAYLWLAFVLRRFPYTRPWGESLRALLLAQLGSLGRTLIDAVPGLFAVLLILVVARAATKAVRVVFEGVERGRVSLPGVYPDTAVPTRRLVSALVWLAALAVAYPYVPGSESAGFKGISVFVGLVISLGSTGVVQHLMSGLMLTFSRAVHPGDFARIGDVEGTVLQVGALATKVRTPSSEEVTIPNALIVSQTVVNYSNAAGTGVPARVATSVTIGYDTPWRQIEALLLIAADRTPGVRRTPAPIVRRAALEDFYVTHTLLVAPEDPSARVELRDRLHAAILDAFNEAGVQIMSPHYECDPATPKVVPPERWHLRPADSQHIVSDRPPAATRR